MTLNVNEYLAYQDIVYDFRAEIEGTGNWSEV